MVRISAPPKTPSKPIQTADEIYSTPVGKMASNEGTSGGGEHEQEQRGARGRQIRRSTIMGGNMEGEEEPIFSFNAFYDEVTSDEENARALFNSICNNVNEIKDLKEEIQDLTQQLDNAKSMYETLSDSLHHHHDPDTNEELYQLRETKIKLCTKLDKVGSQIRQLEDEKQASTAKITSLKDEVTVLQQQVTIAKDQRKKDLQEQRELRATNTGLEALLKEATDKLQDDLAMIAASVDIDAITVANENLQHQVEVLTAQLNVLKKSVFNRPSSEKSTLPPRGRRRSTSTDSEPSVTSAKTRKGREPNVKDPSPLTDGKEPTFENWEKAMKTLFIMKFNTFAEDDAKMGTIWNLTSGTAQQRLEGRYMSEENPYTTSAEMMADLRLAFIDPNRQQNAKIKFNKLKMDDTETFSSFEQVFHHLATASKIPLSYWRDELLEKITMSLQGECIVTRDNHLTYQGIKEHLETIDQRRRLMKTRSAAFRTRSPAPPPSFIPQRERARSPAPANLPFVANKSAKTEDLSFIKCHNCKKFGHMMRDCTELKATVAEMTGTEVMELYEAAARMEKEQGNDST